jgi:putative transposase
MDIFDLCPVDLLGHCVFKMHVHWVFVTKYRTRIFDGAAISYLRMVFEKVGADFESTLAGINGEDNHVHLLVHYPPEHSVSTLVDSLKGVSSRMLRQERPDLAQRYWKGVLGSPSYFAAPCGGQPIAVLKAFIEQQKTPL